MAEKIYLPRLGQTMKEGTLVKWLKEDGAQIKKGDEIYTLEYDKATVDVESPADGILRIEVGEGETVDVGTVVGTIGDGVEAAEGKPAPAAGNGAEERKKVSPLAKKLAKERGINIREVAAGNGGKVSEKDVLAYIESRGAKKRKRPRRQEEAACGSRRWHESWLKRKGLIRRNWLQETEAGGYRCKTSRTILRRRETHLFLRKRK